MVISVINEVDENIVAMHMKLGIKNKEWPDGVL